MDYVPLIVDQDILVMPVLNLEDVAYKRIRSQTLAKRILGLLEILGFRIAPSKFVDEILVKRGAMLSMNFVETLRIGHEFDQATIRSSCQDLIRLHPQIAPLELENLIDLAHQLHRELLLPNIIVRLNNHAKKPPGF